MKILAVIDSFRVGGSERQLAEVLARLSENRVHDCVACSLEPRTPERVQFVENITTDTLRKRSPFDLPGASRRLSELILHYRPDVLYSRLPCANAITRVAVAISRTRIPHVAGVDTMPILYRGVSALKYRFYSVFERRADRIICNSEATATAVIDRGYSRGKVRVVYNGVDTTRYCPIMSKPAQSGPAQLITVGALRSEKDFPRLLAAIPLILAHTPVHLTIVGDGAEKRTLEHHVQSLGISRFVTFLGVRHDVHHLLRAADLFVMTPVVEGLGMAVMEAAAVAVPAVVTDAPGGLREIVIDGITGFRTPPDDLARFAQRVVELCRAPARRTAMGEAARRLMVQRFSLQQTVHELETCLTF